VSDTQTLEQVRRLAAAAGAPEIAAEADAVLQRAAEGRFFVACVGEFKRGKSTLINALLDLPVLPTGVIPVTSVPTVVRHGDPGARVRQDGRWRSIDHDDLADYVSQERNPGNAKRVIGVEVFVPHPLLRDGLCLVDTPGLGSVFDANTSSTLDFLPHIDAAIVILGADPPVSGEELRFAADLGRQVDTLFFVLNKADRTPAAHRAEAVDFTRRVLEESLGRHVDPIYQVCATEPGRELAAAHGWREFVAALERLPGESGRRLALSAARRATARLGRRLTALLEEERRALVAPLADAERRLEDLRALAMGADRTRRELGPLLHAEEQELLRVFERRRTEFLAGALPEAVAELDRRFGDRWSKHMALEEANRIARDRLAAWLATSEREADGAYAAAMARYGDLARGFLARVAGAAGIAAEAVEVDEALWSELRTPRGFRFTDLLPYHVSPLPWAGLMDRLLPGVVARPRRRAAARRYVRHLLTVNATRVESDLRDRLYEGRLRLQRELDRLLRQVGAEARRAAERGFATKADGEAAVRDRLGQLTAWLAELEALHQGSVTSGMKEAAHGLP
jgi:Dynamin family